MPVEERLIVDAGGGAIDVGLHVQPRSSRPGLAGIHGGVLKVRVAAPPEGGRATAEALALLAGVFGVSPRSVELRSGASSRDKRVRVHGVDPHAAEAALVAALEGLDPPRAGRGTGRRSPPEQR